MSRPVRTGALVFVAVVGLLGGAVHAWTEWSPAVGFLVAGVAALAAAGAAWRRADREGEGTDAWAFVPSWQYGGRHAESGGLARDEQERALEELRAAADERERERRR